MDSIVNRWLLTLGIATVCFGVFLFVLHVPIRTIGIFFVLGIPLILLWLYVDEKSKPQQGKKISDSINLEQQCICSICNHEQAGICLNQKCACCINMRGDKVIGHSINPIQ